jgi:uncharacterized iron-regulated membrane protein
MFEHALRAYPELDVERVLLPLNHGQPVALLGQTGAILVRPRANAIAFDPASGDEVHRHHARQLDVHQRISEAADPLHFGTFGGLATRVLWFVFGVGMCALSLTGVYLYGLRIAASSQRRSAREGAGA